MCLDVDLSRGIFLYVEAFKIKEVDAVDLESVNLLWLHLSDCTGLCVVSRERYADHLGYRSQIVSDIVIDISVNDISLDEK